MSCQSLSVETRRQVHPEQGSIRYSVCRTSLGFVLVGATEVGLCALFLGDSPQPLVDDLKRRFPKVQLVPDDAGMSDYVQAVRQFVEAPTVTPDLLLDVHGTPFQRKVWATLREIPAGSTATYTQIAERIGNPKAVRAVAQACGANPVALLIPCHRVVRTDGSISGYRWGVERKAELLRREGVNPDRKPC